MKPKILLCLALVPLIFGNRAEAEMMGPPLPLDKLADQADIIFKGTAVSSVPVQDTSLPPVKSEFTVQETQFKVVSTVKGDKPGDILKFHHYDVPNMQGSSTDFPQFYHFEPGRTYLVFAKKSDPGIFIQLSNHPTAKVDQGAVLCANDQPAFVGTIKEVVWFELIGMLRSTKSDDVTYARSQLDQMSDGGSGGFGALSDFDRKDVIEAEHEITPSQLDSVNGLLDQFVQTQSLQLLIDAFRKMDKEPFPLEEQSLAQQEKTRAWLGTWLRILALVEANKDMTFTKDDQAYTEIDVPGEGGKGYPSGTDPKDVKDPATRAAYIKALEENNKKAQRAYLHSQIVGIDLILPTSMRIYLGAYFKTPEEKNEAKEMVTQSDLSEATKTILLDSLNKK